MIDVSRETTELLRRYETLVVEGNEQQNLVSASSLADFGSRHVADALQLVELAPPGSSWCDVGSGAGLPGIVIAIVSGDPVTLIEPRRLRAAFLRHAVAELGLGKVHVVEAKSERAEGQYDVITARAVAELGKLFAITEHLARSGTRWILPKGRGAKKELADAQLSWQGEFRLVPSRTSDEAMIVLGDRVRRRGKA